MRYRFKFAVTSVALIIAAVILILSCGKKEIPQPPVAKKIAHADTLFGDVRTDPYFWLREKENPEVIDYLNAENDYTQAMMAHTEKFQKKLYKEMLGRIKETDLSVPVRKDDYYYYTRTEEGKQYPIHCRKKGDLNAEEEILLDENELSKDYDQFEMGIFGMSPDHTLLAYSTDTTGSETYTIYVKDLETGALFADQIPNTVYGFEWASDNRTFFYTIMDEARRPYKLFRHTLGSDPKEDVLVFHEKDDRFWMTVSKTRSEKYLMIILGSMVTTEVWYLDADTPNEAFKRIHPRQQDMEYYAAHHGEFFYIMTNDDAENFKIVKAPVSNPAKRKWETVIPHRKDVKIDNFDLFQGHLVSYERKDGLKEIQILRISDGESHYVEFPEPVYTYQENSNPEFNTSLLRFTYESLVTPKSVFDYDMLEKSRELKKQDEVVGGYNADEYQSERIWAKAEDGVKVPISLVYKKKLKKVGPQSCLLYGYGSYGYSMEPRFSSNRLSLLDRGFVYAIGHIRGGGEMGRWWYEDGKLLNKKNTFTDFIACAEHLVKEEYTSPDELAALGGSAGGLLMGAINNMRPDLFHVIVAHVPFVDVVNTMLDESIPLTVIEYEEWGNPHKKKFYKYMNSYSPYDNVEAREYPNILITAGLNDPRVQYWEPAKWTAKLRDMKTDENVLLLKTKMGSGHFGASGRYDALKEVAFEYAFLLDQFGIKK